MSQRVSLALKCDVISEVQHGCPPSDVARKYSINEDEIWKWMKSASTQHEKFQAQWSTKTDKRTKYSISTKFAAIMDYEHTNNVSRVSEKHDLPRQTLSQWLLKADDIKQLYKQSTDDGQPQPEDKSSSCATVEPTTDAPLDLRTNVTLQQRSSALLDDSDAALVRSDHTAMAVEMKSLAELDAPVAMPCPHDVSVSLYSDAYRLCGSIEEMMALHGITMDDVKATAM